MCKRILLSTLTAITMLVGVGMAGATEGRFVFRGKPGVITLASASSEAPEVPEVPEGDPRRTAFEDGFQSWFGFDVDDPEAENITQTPMEHFLNFVVAYNLPDLDGAIRSYFGDDGWSIGNVLPPYATMRDFFEKAVIPVYGCPTNC